MMKKNIFKIVLCISSVLFLAKCAHDTEKRSVCPNILITEQARSIVLFTPARNLSENNIRYSAKIKEHDFQCHVKGNKVHIDITPHTHIQSNNRSAGKYNISYFVAVADNTGHIFHKDIHHVPFTFDRYVRQTISPTISKTYDKVIFETDDIKKNKTVFFGFHMDEKDWENLQEWQKKLKGYVHG